MGQAWFCSVCGDAVPLPRVEAGMCSVVPRSPDCPLRPRDPVTAEPTAPLTPSGAEALEQ